MSVFCHPGLLNRNSAVQMEMYATVETWVNSLGPADKARMLDGLSKAGVRAGRHHDTERKDGMGGFGTSHGHSQGGNQQGLGQVPIVGGYLQQAQNTFQHAMPGQGGGHQGGGGGGIGGFVQQASGILGGGHGGGGGVGSYISQAQQLFGGQSSGGGGLGGFMQNLAGGGGRRREINEDDDAPVSGGQGGYPRERGERVDELDEERDQERAQFPEPSYSRPSSGDYGEGQTGYPPQSGYGQPPYGQGGYDGRRY